MAGFLSRCIEKIKSWIHWSWTYLLAVWVVLVVFVVYILRGPLKLSENLSYGKGILYQQCLCVFKTKLMCFLCQHIVYHLVCCSFFVNVRNLRLESHEFGKWTDSVIITLWNMHLYFNTCEVSSNGMYAMLFSICAICKQSILCGIFLYRSPKYENCQGFCSILYLGLHSDTVIRQNVLKFKKASYKWNTN